MNRSLKNDYRYCKKIIKKNSKSFYFAFSKLPKQKAESVYAIYFFCRIIDNAVDNTETVEDAKKKLEIFNKYLDLVYSGIIPDEPGWAAFSDTVKKWKIPKKPFWEQIQGQYLDLNFKQFSSLDELLVYCDFVAGSVGRMLLPILATKNKEKLVEKVGIIGEAMQITNILRDVGEDFNDRNRIYIPSDLLEQYQFSLENFQLGKVDRNFILIWEELAKKAEKFYEEGLRLILQFDKDSISPVFFSILIYREIHNAVRKNDYNCFSFRNFVKKREMVSIILEGKKKLKLR